MLGIQLAEKMLLENKILYHKIFSKDLRNSFWLYLFALFMQLW